MKWVEGRQGGGYYKLTLLECSWPFKFDVHILKFAPGARIKPHMDPSVEGYEHHRLNIVLKSSYGKFWTEDKPDFWTSRIMKFRPDIVSHGLISDMWKQPKTGYWLSIGWLKKK